MALGIRPSLSLALRYEIVCVHKFDGIDSADTLCTHLADAEHVADLYAENEGGSFAVIDLLHYDMVYMAGEMKSLWNVALAT